MNTENTSTGAWWRPGNLWCRFNRLCACMPGDVAALVGRVAVFTVFWNAAQSKIEGWTFLGQHWQFFGLNQNTFFLFQHEYAVPLLPPVFAAYAGTFGEFFLSLMLLLGFGTRFAALGLVVMTAVIQSVYPDAWKVHILWFAVLLYLLKHGGGRASLDHLACRLCRSC